uniref:Integrase catalytic domain-containing protein n=1 Tax=Panagrolaimus superbus TaxID=310955 RepID=A0A914ZDX7_9BILA
MSFKSKSVFTNSRKRAWELCTQATDESLQSSSSGFDFLAAATKLLTLKDNIVKEQTSCKDYHQQWINCNEEIKTSNPTKYDEEKTALDELFNKEDGINALYTKMKESLQHLDALIMQSVNESSRLFLQQQNSQPPIHPSAPVQSPPPAVQLVQPAPLIPPNPNTDSSTTAPAPRSLFFQQPVMPMPTQQRVTFAPQNPQTNISQAVDPYAPQGLQSFSNPPSQSILQAFNPQQSSAMPSTQAINPAGPAHCGSMYLNNGFTTNQSCPPLASVLPSNSTYAPQSSSALPTASTAPQNQAMPSINQQQFFNIPKTNLPTFSGNPKDYRFWWQAFSIIHNDHTISNMHKHHVLRNLLKGKAYDLICYYDINFTNYDLVVRDLYQQFGRKELVVEALFREFKNIQITSSNIEDIEKAVIGMESILKQLETEGVNIEDTTWKMLYREKIPPHILQTTNLYGLDPTFALLRERVLLIVRAEKEIPNASFQNFRNSQHFNAQRQNYRLPNIQNYHPQQHRINHYTPHHQQKPPITPHSNQSSDERHRPKSRSCVFCGKHQNSSSCRTVKDASERKKIASEKRLCFKCLDPHHPKSCKDSKPCANCNESHHEALCFKNPELNTKQVHAVKLQPSKKKEVSMMVIQAPVGSNVQQKLTNVNLFLDCGAACSFIHADVAHRLKLPIIEEELLDLQRFGDNGMISSLQVISKKVNLVVMAQNNKAVPITAYTINNLTTVLPTIDPETKSKKLVKPDILIGNDFFWDFFASEKSEDGYKIVESLLGKIVCGTGIPMYSILPSQHPPESTNEIVEKFFKIDQAGTDESPYTKEEDIAVEKFINETEIVDGRMQCRLPFSVADPPLDSNRTLALKCLESQLRKLLKRPDMLREIDKGMKQQLNDQITEIAPKISPSPGKVYLPHHAIETPHKSTKVRIVFNSSAKSSKNSKSLNDWLYAGPSLIPEIPGLLLRIRLMQVLVSADVEKAFLQLRLHPDDRDYTRFFWLKDVDDYFKNGFRLDNIIELRFCTIFFGGKSSPFSLNAAIRKLLLNLDDANFATQLKSNTYVDNVFIGGSVTEDVIEKTETAIELFKSIKMNLRDVVSSDSKINKHFNVQPALLSVLGLQWNPVADTITVKMPSNATEKPGVTKREVLAEIASKYDPLGILAPITVRLKLFMQDLWKKNTSWDEKLSPDETSKWKILIEEPMAVTVDRYLKPVEGAIDYELHIFCDASAKAYAAVAYILSRNQLGETKKYLIMSKSKIVPVKPVTIPRLELLALTLGANVLKYIKANVDIKWSKTVLWTDSSAVFYWLHSNKPLKRFVDNRVNIVKAAEAEIRHVPTKQNPADIASRGSSVAALKDCKLWWNGPAFLKDDASRWPNLPVSDEPEKSAEVEKEFIFAVWPCVKAAKSKLISVENGSSWNRLVRVAAYCIYFINKCRKQGSPDPRSTQAFKTAEKVLIKDIQQANFPDEATCRSLRIFTDENNMLRCRSRLENSKNAELAAPLFLPRCGESNLLILKIHHDTMHAGARHVLTELRQSFWLTRGLSTVKKAIKGCRPCLKFKAKPYQLPEMAALPSSRVTQCTPFQHIGVDCAGPFTVKTNGEDVKTWIVLFTCLTTRAVYLDMVKEMSALAFINALRRFASTCGTPLSILSDNGSNFKAAGTHISLIM